MSPPDDLHVDSDVHEEGAPLVQRERRTGRSAWLMLVVNKTSGSIEISSKLRYMVIWV